MNIIYFLSGTKEIKKVKVRLYHNRLDIPASTNLLAKVEEWDAETQLFKQYKGKDKELKQKNEDNIAKLLALKKIIHKEFNNDFANGEIINVDWLKKIIAKAFFRPNAEEKMLNHRNTIYLYDFGKDWLENKSSKWRNSKSKPLTNKAKSQYLKTLEFFKEYQGERQIKLKDFTTQEIEGFFDFIMDKKYSFVTAKKKLTELKFLCDKAQKLKLNINTDYLIPILRTDPYPEIEEIYLNESEIESIFNYDFSDNETMDIIRDNFILSLWTGIRLSDLSTLDSKNLINGLLEVKSVKTNTISKIPLHPQVKYTLEKRFGNLPPKANKDQYNVLIKEICRLCKIDSPTFGKIKDKEKNREIAGYYPKYKLVSSHIARRSYATNLSDKISTKAIAKMLGHKSEKMTEFYNKKSKLEYAYELNEILNPTQEKK